MTVANIKTDSDDSDSEARKERVTWLQWIVLLMMSRIVSVQYNQYHYVTRSALLLRAIFPGLSLDSPSPVAHLFKLWCSQYHFTA